MPATVEILVPDTLVKALGARPNDLPRQTLAVVYKLFREFGARGA
jgi:hypothetical protein